MLGTILGMGNIAVNKVLASAELNSITGMHCQFAIYKISTLSVHWSMISCYYLCLVSIHLSGLYLTPISSSYPVHLMHFQGSMLGNTVLIITLFLKISLKGFHMVTSVAYPLACHLKFSIIWCQPTFGMLSFNCSLLWTLCSVLHLVNLETSACNTPHQLCLKEVYPLFMTQLTKPPQKEALSLVIICTVFYTCLMASVTSCLVLQA